MNLHVKSWTFLVTTWIFLKLRKDLAEKHKSHLSKLQTEINN